METVMWTSLAIVGILCLLVASIPISRWYRLRDDQRGIAQFQIRREMLEARFFDLARIQGKPRDLRWVECDWQSGVQFARDRKSGLLTAFVDVNIRFEAIEGGEMEGVAAVGVVRDAVAVFHYRDGVWGTGGKALFNMNAADAIQNLAGQYEPVVALHRLH